MSITKKSNGDGVENGDGYSCLSMADGEEKIIYGEEKGMKENKGIFLDSSSCSSIGKNSDDDDDEEDVQSSYNCGNGNGSFDSIQALEEALPMRRGMSRFYNGKSKSFTSLTDASSSPFIKEIAKPENAYSRRRRNLLAFNLLSDKNRSLQPKSNGVSKRSANTGRTTLALAVAMSSNNPRTHETEGNSDSSPNFVSRLSPHHPQFIQSHCNGNFSAWRSFSFADLHHCGSLKAPAPR